MEQAYTEDIYPKEKITIKVDGVSADVETELGQTEGCLRNKVRIAELEKRLAVVEKLLGVTK